MLLNTLNQTLTYKDADDFVKPAEGATVAVQRCGCTVRTTVSHVAGTLKNIDVEGFNSVKEGDILQLNNDATTTVTVTNIDDTNRRVKCTLASPIDFTAGDRLVPTDATVILYESELGDVKAADNNLTTDANGAIKAYTQLQQVDLLVSGTMYASAFVIADVQVPMNQMFTPRHFGAQGNGISISTAAYTDELEILQNAVDRLAEWGVNTLWIDSRYGVNGTLTLPAGFEIRGVNATDARIYGKQTDATPIIDDNGNTGVKLRDFNLNGAGDLAAQLDGVRSTIDNMTISVSGDTALAYGSTSSDCSIRYSSISANLKTITLDDCERPRIETCDVYVGSSGGTCIEMNATASAIDGAFIGGNTTLWAILGGKALDCNGTVTNNIRLVIGGLYVRNGTADFTYTETMSNGFRIEPTDVTLDTFSKGNFVGTLNDNILPAWSNGTPGGTPTPDTFPMRWDAANDKLWIHNGTAWISTTFGDPAQDLEEASLYISSAAATTIAVGGTYQKASGTTTVVTETPNMDATTGNNRIQYTGTSAKRFYIHAAISLTASTTPNEDASICIYKYDNNAGSGAVIAATEIQRYLSATAGQKGAVAVLGHVDLDQNDYVEVWVTRPTGGGGETITLNKMFLSAVEIGSM